MSKGCGFKLSGVPSTESSGIFRKKKVLPERACLGESSKQKPDSVRCRGRCDSVSRKRRDLRDCRICQAPCKYEPNSDTVGVTRASRFNSELDIGWAKSNA